MSHMNRYLAISHLLSLFEAPIAITPFIQATQDHNPLFIQSCITPGKWLFFMAKEGMLIQEEGTFRLTPLGQRLAAHILRWTQRDKTAVAEKVSLYRMIQPLKAPTQCPTCRSHYCALNIFCLLIERVREGLSDWNQWDLEALTLFSQFLNAEYSGQNLQLYIHGQTQVAQDLVWMDKERLARALAQVLEAHDSDLIRDFLAAFGQTRLIRGLPQLDLKAQMVSSLRLAYGLYNPQLLKTLRSLAYPEIYGDIYAPWEPDADIRYLFLSGVGFNPEKNQALLHVAEGQQHQLVALAKQEDAWQIVRRIPYQLREEIN